jgi:hypothetical protein
VSEEEDKLYLLTGVSVCADGLRPHGRFSASARARLPSARTGFFNDCG